jgi:hypothetical protein
LNIRDAFGSKEFQTAEIKEQAAALRNNAARIFGEIRGVGCVDF